MKTCRKCGLEKPDGAFGIHQSTMRGKRYVYPNKDCNGCRAESDRIRRRNFPNKASTRKSQLKIKYGLTPEDFEMMLREQSEQCLICQQKMAVPNIDHCHQTGKVRGLLCSNCNTGLGRFKDCKKNLLRAVLYLIKHSTEKTNQKTER